MKKIERSDAIEKGLPFYFTGRPCLNGHVAKRTTICGGCDECRAERQREYRKNLQKLISTDSNDIKSGRADVR